MAKTCSDWISVFVYVVADWLNSVAWRNAAGRRSGGDLNGLGFVNVFYRT